MNVRERFKRWFDGSHRNTDIEWVADRGWWRGHSDVEAAWDSYLSAWRAARDEAVRVCLDQRCKWCRDAGETNRNHSDCCACRDDADAIRATLSDAPLAANDARMEGA